MALHSNDEEAIGHFVRKVMTVERSNELMRGTSHHTREPCLYVTIFQTLSRRDIYDLSEQFSISLRDYIRVDLYRVGNFMRLEFY